MGFQAAIVSCCVSPSLSLYFYQLGLFGFLATVALGLHSYGSAEFAYSESHHSTLTFILNWTHPIIIEQTSTKPAFHRTRCWYWTCFTIMQLSCLTFFYYPFFLSIFVKHFRNKGDLSCKQNVWDSGCHFMNLDMLCHE